MSNMRSITTAAVYCRISSDREGEAAGVARQEQDARSLADRKGWNVGPVFVDNDVSASRKGGKVAHRPGFEALREAVERRQVQAVVGWDLDRMFRDPLEQEQFLLLCEQVGLHHIATIADDLDVSSGYGVMVARIKAAVAAEEARKIGQRVRRKHLELAEAGRPSGGGTRPFGYTSDRLHVVESEAALIREAVARLAAGERLRAVCADWNARGVSTVTGAPWTPFVLRRLVCSARVAGWREHRGVWVAPAVWPAIVDRDEVELVRQRLLDPSRRVNGNPTRYLLTGLVRCGLCEARLVARPRDDKRRCYVCARGPGFKGCGKIRALSDPLEAHVVDEVLAYLDAPAFARAFAATKERDDELASATAEVAAARAKQEALAGQWARDEITDDEWRAARAGVDERLRAAESRVAAVRPRSALELVGRGEALRRDWEAMTFAEQRAVLESVPGLAIVVGPARKGLNRFDPGRVRIWVLGALVRANS